MWEEGKRDTSGIFFVIMSGKDGKTLSRGHFRKKRGSNDKVRCKVTTKHHSIPVFNMIYQWCQGYHNNRFLNETLHVTQALSQLYLTPTSHFQNWTPCLDLELLSLAHLQETKNTSTTRGLRSNSNWSYYGQRCAGTTLLLPRLDWKELVVEWIVVFRILVG